MTNVELYTLQIVLEDGPFNRLDGPRVAAIMAETEQNVTDLLPAGYVCRIHRWNHDEGEPSE